MISKKISSLDLHELRVRSGLTCGLEYGVCQKCYGWAMTTQKLVDIGEAIGIIAAQSIGEPGTQLTMRTFHTGGAVGVKEAKKEILAREAGTVVSKIKARELRTRHGDVVQVSMYEADIEVKGEKEQLNIIFLPVLHCLLLTVWKLLKVSKWQNTLQLLLVTALV